MHTSRCQHLSPLTPGTQISSRGPYRLPELTLADLCAEAHRFSILESTHLEPSLYGVTDGKAVGTYVEQKFRRYLRGCGYEFVEGNSASGIDFPSLGVDMKVTSIRQPQSSCPFKSARQKIYGLGYSLLVLVYDKADNPIARTATLRVTHAIFVERERTADFQMTSGLLKIVSNEGNIDDISAYMLERNLPVDEIELYKLAEEILERPPALGYLTISNALQWRLQYRRVIDFAGSIDGITALYRSPDV
ncbi:hypothetical protein SAMN05216486_11615 [bacterium JGI 053]|nr:hypothetical protein SAMN05216486_11615 [bacterium JGI 053]